jgi:dolichol-phosphate mannosyltransferase
MELLSIIIPVYSEEEVIDECYRRVKAMLNTLRDIDHEIIFINDGSTDNTLHKLKSICRKDKKVKITSFSKNFGHQVAVTAGLKKSRGDMIAIMDADLQDPPELIPKMIEKLKEGYDLVYGKRKKREDKKVKKFIAAFYYRILEKMSETRIPVDTSDFALLNRKVVNALNKMEERNRYLRGLRAWVGFNQTNFDFDRDARFAGETKYPFLKSLKLGIDGIISFSKKPLKIATYTGILAIFSAVSITIYALISKLFFGVATAKGWTSLIIIVVFFGGLQLITLGILGEYLGRIYDEVKKRPLYFVDEEINY